MFCSLQAGFCNGLQRAELSRSPQQPGGDSGMGDGLLAGSPGLASVGRAPVRCLEQACGRSGSR